MDIKRQFLEERAASEQSKLLLVCVMIVAVGLLVGVGCPGPEDDACKEAKHKYPECEATGGKWVSYPMRAVDVAESCDCDCGDDAIYMDEKGCQPTIPPIEEAL